MDEWKAGMEEFEAESAYLVRPGRESLPKIVRVFKDQGGLVRIAMSPMQGDEEELQLVIGREHLIRRLEDPQDPL